MPFAGYPSFDACVTDQLDRGHSEDSARRICGALQAEAEKEGSMPAVQIPLMLEVNVRTGAPESPEEKARKLLEQAQKTEKGERATFESQGRVLKATAEPEGTTLHYVLSVVLEENAPDSGVTSDTQGDAYSKADIWEARRSYMEKQQLGLMHRGLAKGVALLDNWITPVAFEFGGQQVTEGSWLMGVEIDEADPDGAALWQGIKSGAVNAFSIGGTGERIPLE